MDGLRFIGSCGHSYEALIQIVKFYVQASVDKSPGANIL